jgi:hypothetical protein
MGYYVGHLPISTENIAHSITAMWHALRRCLATICRPFILSTRCSKHTPQTAAHELHTARALLAQGQVRAAGAVAGVALELHLKHVARVQGITVRPYATITQVQDTLRYAGLITRQQRKLIQKLAAIRNQCVHARPEPPSYSKVAKLIQGIEQLMQEAEQRCGDA